MQRFLPSAALALCLLPAITLASEGNPGVDACKTLGEGDACSYKEPSKGPDGLVYNDVAGTCQQDECCEQDYSQGSPPELKCGPCLACKPGDAPGDSAGLGKGEPPKAGDDPPAAAGSNRGCTTGGEAPWFSLILLPLAAVRRRR